MKKTLRKSRKFSWMLVVALLISLLPTAAFAANDEYDTSDAVSFVFSDSSITTDDTENTSCYKIEGTSLTIKSAGTYILSGSCADGSVTVKKGTTDVTIVLNGLTLTNTGSSTSATAPLTCNKSTGVTIVAADGTINTLTDSIYNNDETYTENEDAENAVIKCKDGAQIVITGSGELNIVSNGKNGIKSGTTDSETDASNPRDASLTIKNVTLNITTTVNDAINAEQNLSILSGNLTINAADDAIHSDYDLVIGASGTTGPAINITGSTEGIEGATISIYSGDISILSSDDCINAANSDLSNYDFSINIYGGTIYAYTTSGDGFDSNGSLTISGGNVEVWSANTADNQPLDAETSVTISGGTVFAAGGSSGMGLSVNATQTYTVFGNSANGQPGSGMQNGQQPTMPGNQQSASQQSDSQSGQQPSMPSGQRTGMQGSQQPNMTNSQQSGTQNNQQQIGTQPNQQFGSQETIISKGSTVSVTDSEGNAVYTTTAPCNAGYVLFSSSSMSDSETYSLSVDGNTTDGNSTDNTNSGNIFSDVFNSDWYYNAVQYVYNHQLMLGTALNSFSPNLETTRQQIWMILARISGENPSNMTEARNWAMENGLTDGTYPTKEITREQLATMLYRFAEMNGYNVSISGSLSNYSDADDVSSYATVAVNWAVSSNLINGTGSTTLSPNGITTRAQLAIVLMRFCNNYNV